MRIGPHVSCIRALHPPPPPPILLHISYSITPKPRLLVKNSIGGSHNLLCPVYSSSLSHDIILTLELIPQLLGTQQKQQKQTHLSHFFILSDQITVIQT